MLSPLDGEVRYPWTMTVHRWRKSNGYIDYGRFVLEWTNTITGNTYHSDIQGHAYGQGTADKLVREALGTIAAARLGPVHGQHTSRPLVIESFVDRRDFQILSGCVTRDKNKDFYLFLMGLDK